MPHPQPPLRRSTTSIITTTITTPTNTVEKSPGNKYPLVARDKYLRGQGTRLSFSQSEMWTRVPKQVTLHHRLTSLLPDVLIIISDKCHCPIY